VSLALLVVIVSVVAVMASREIRGVEPASTTGTTDPIAYSLVRPGQTRAQVVDVLGSPPRAVESVPLGGARTRPRCYVYDRRSGLPGHYRFCFKGGLMVSKSRVGWPAPA
jgi:hypothetical protein